MNKYDSRTMLCQECDDEFSAKSKQLTFGHKQGVGYTAIPDYSKLHDFSACNLVLDWIAGAAEEGFLTHENYIEKTFKKKSDWKKFLDDLREYEFWLNERHAYAWVQLLNYSSPDDFMTYEGLADALSSELD